MARVHRGIHRESGREAAIKVPKNGPLGAPRFLREIDVLQRLDHPHVMPILEIDGRRRWYAMPLADNSLPTCTGVTPSTGSSCARRSARSPAH
jgi:serine/threonine protein kinase